LTGAKRRLVFFVSFVLFVLKETAPAARTSLK
jgi:hypothetical protein